MNTVTLPASTLRIIAAAPHRLMFFIGATNVLLAMVWWAAWLIDARWLGSHIAPLLAAPGMDRLYLANRARLHELHRLPVDARGVNLDAHLRDELLFGRDAP